MPILPPVETPDLFDFDDPGPEQEQPRQQPPPQRGPAPQLRPGGAIWSQGARIAWVAGLILMLSSFMSWYAGKSVEGPTLAVIGWHTGTIGKLVFFVGLAAIALGALGTILVLVRLISIPDTFAGTSGRAIGIWIALLSALAVIVAGLLRASEEL